MKNLVEVVFPVGLLLFRENVPCGQEGGVKAFHLSIALRVVLRCSGVGVPLPTGEVKDSFRSACIGHLYAVGLHHILR